MMKPKPMREVATKRFWRLVNKDAPNGCWLWTGPVNRLLGVGVYHQRDGNLRGLPRMVHRFSWEIHNGPVARRHYVTQRCDHWLCVRPDHLICATKLVLARFRAEQESGIVPVTIAKLEASRLAIEMSLRRPEHCRFDAPWAVRFWAKCEIGPAGSCWPWRGFIDAGGYGSVNFKGAKVRAHRAALILTSSAAPEGCFACHHCDNPPCVNPGHLYWGTPKQNAADAVGRGRLGGELAVSAKLTAKQVRWLRANYTGARGQITAWAREFGVNRRTIHFALQGKTWRTTP
jgi:HNH endonuclease